MLRGRKPERSPETEAAYERIYRRFQRWVREADALARDDPVEPQRIAGYFVQREGTWKRASARLYRAALTALFERFEGAGDERATVAKQLMKDDLIDEADRLARRAAVRAEQAALAKRVGLRTSSRKVKRLSQSDAQLLMRHLYGTGFQVGVEAATWYAAGMATGLRPGEWETATLDVDVDLNRVLVVDNAKRSNGRAHGDKRSIVLNGANADQLRCIAAHLEAVQLAKEMPGGFDGFYERCRKAVARASLALWPRRPKRPTLYTARHLFAASAKRVMTKEEVAALMGHASTETAQAHYAPRWSGGSVGVRPHADDVESVVQLNRHRVVSKPSALERAKGLPPFKDGTTEIEGLT